MATKILKTVARVYRTTANGHRRYFYNVTTPSGAMLAVTRQLYTRKSGAVRGALRQFPKTAVRDLTGEGRRGA